MPESGSNENKFQELELLKSCFFVPTVPKYVLEHVTSAVSTFEMERVERYL
jgi:hypothetical protein